MLTIICTMALGIVAGYFLRHRKLKHLDSAMLVIIWLLLFILGVEAGCNDKIVKWIATLGMEAFIISLGGVIGSSLLALALWKYAQNDREERSSDEG